MAGEESTSQVTDISPEEPNTALQEQHTNIDSAQDKIMAGENLTPEDTELLKKHYGEKVDSFQQHMNNLLEGAESSEATAVVTKGLKDTFRVIEADITSLRVAKRNEETGDPTIRTLADVASDFNKFVARKLESITALVGLATADEQQSNTTIRGSEEDPQEVPSPDTPRREEELQEPEESMPEKRERSEQERPSNLRHIEQLLGIDIAANISEIETTELSLFSLAQRQSKGLQSLSKFHKEYRRQRDEYFGIASNTNTDEGLYENIGTILTMNRNEDELNEKISKQQEIIASEVAEGLLRTLDTSTEDYTEATEALTKYAATASISIKVAIATAIYEKVPKLLADMEKEGQSGQLMRKLILIESILSTSPQGKLLMKTTASLRESMYSADEPLDTGEDWKKVVSFLSGIMVDKEGEEVPLLSADELEDPMNLLSAEKMTELENYAREVLEKRAKKRQDVQSRIQMIDYLLQSNLDATQQGVANEHAHNPKVQAFHNAIKEAIYSGIADDIPAAIAHLKSSGKFVKYESAEIPQGNESEEVALRIKRQQENIQYFNSLLGKWQYALTSSTQNHFEFANMGLLEQGFRLTNIIGVQEGEQWGRDTVDTPPADSETMMLGISRVMRNRRGANNLLESRNILFQLLEGRTFETAEGESIGVLEKMTELYEHNEKETFQDLVEEYKRVNRNKVYEETASKREYLQLQMASAFLVNDLGLEEYANEEDTEKLVSIARQKYKEVLGLEFDAAVEEKIVQQTEEAISIIALQNANKHVVTWALERGLEKNMGLSSHQQQAVKDLKDSYGLGGWLDFSDENRALTEQITYLAVIETAVMMSGAGIAAKGAGVVTKRVALALARKKMADQARRKAFQMGERKATEYLLTSAGRGGTALARTAGFATEAILFHEASSLIRATVVEKDLTQLTEQSFAEHLDGWVHSAIALGVIKAAGAGWNKAAGNALTKGSQQAYLTSAARGRALQVANQMGSIGTESIAFLASGMDPAAFTDPEAWANTLATVLALKVGGRIAHGKKGMSLREFKARHEAMQRRMKKIEAQKPTKEAAEEASAALREYVEIAEAFEKAIENGELGTAESVEAFLQKFDANMQRIRQAREKLEQRRNDLENTRANKQEREFLYDQMAELQLNISTIQIQLGKMRKASEALPKQKAPESATTPDKPATALYKTKMTSEVPAEALNADGSKPPAYIGKDGQIVYVKESAIANMKQALSTMNKGELKVEVNSEGVFVIEGVPCRTTQEFATQMGLSKRQAVKVLKAYREAWKPFKNHEVTHRIVDIMPRSAQKALAKTAKKGYWFKGKEGFDGKPYTPENVQEFLCTVAEGNSAFNKGLPIKAIEKAIFENLSPNAREAVEQIHQLSGTGEAVFSFDLVRRYDTILLSKNPIAEFVRRRADARSGEAKGGPTEVEWRETSTESGVKKFIEHVFGPKGEMLLGSELISESGTVRTVVDIMGSTVLLQKPSGEIQAWPKDQLLKKADVFIKVRARIAKEVPRANHDLTVKEMESRGFQNIAIPKNPESMKKMLMGAHMSGRSTIAIVKGETYNLSSVNPNSGDIMLTSLATGQARSITFAELQQGNYMVSRKKAKVTSEGNGNLNADFSLPEGASGKSRQALQQQKAIRDLTKKMENEGYTYTTEKEWKDAKLTLDDLVKAIKESNAKFEWPNSKENVLRRLQQSSLEALAKNIVRRIGDPSKVGEISTAIGKALEARRNGELLNPASLEGKVKIKLEYLESIDSQALSLIESATTNGKLEWLLSSGCFEGMLRQRKVVKQVESGEEVTFYSGKQLGKGGIGVVDMVVYKGKNGKIEFGAFKQALPGKEQAFELDFDGAFKTLDWNQSNILKVKENGIHGDFVIYETFTEAVNGHEHLNNPNTRPESAFQLLEGVMDGLQYYKQKGVFHGDIKLENILVVKDANGESRVVIIDNAPVDMASDGGYVSTWAYTMRHTETIVVNGRRVWNPNNPRLKFMRSKMKEGMTEAEANTECNKAFDAYMFSYMVEFTAGRFKDSLSKDTQANLQRFIEALRNPELACQDKFWRDMKKVYKEIMKDVRRETGGS